MMDDPREILRAAGVECPEVDAAAPLLEPAAGCDQCAAYGMRCPDSWTDESPMQIKAAILALARLVAEKQARVERQEGMLRLAVLDEISMQHPMLVWDDPEDMLEIDAMLVYELAELARRYAEQKAADAPR